MLYLEVISLPPHRNLSNCLFFFALLTSSGELEKSLDENPLRLDMCAYFQFKINIDDFPTLSPFLSNRQ